MITEKEFKINDSVIHYKVAGDISKEIIIFLHGWPGIRYSKSSVVEELAKDFYVIAPEHPGLLQSEPLKNYTNIFEQYADVAFKILVKEGLDKNQCIVFGQSFGGIVASVFAEKYNVNTKALVLTDSQMGYQRNDLLRKFLFKYGKQIIYTYIKSPSFIKKHGLKIFFGVLGKEDTKNNDALLKSRVAMVDNYCACFRQAIKEKKNLLDRNYKQMPIIMLWGDKDGTLFSFSGYSKAGDALVLFDKIKNNNPQAEFILFKGGHEVLYKKTREVINKIKEVLDKYI